MRMFLFLFALWLVFNGRLCADVVVTGLVFSAAVTLFGCKVCGWSQKNVRHLGRIAGQILLYGAQVAVEIVKANLSMIGVILSPRCCKAQPQLFFFDTGLSQPLARTLLANSITITPGTYTVGVYDSTLAVHAINPEFAAGTPGSELNRRLVRMEQTLAAKEQEGRA